MLFHAYHPAMIRNALNPEESLNKDEEINAKFIIINDLQENLSKKNQNLRAMTIKSDQPKTLNPAKY
jgi:hypothetical protein